MGILQSSLKKGFNPESAFLLVKKKAWRGKFPRKSVWGYRVEILKSELPSRAAFQAESCSSALFLQGHSYSSRRIDTTQQNGLLESGKSASALMWSVPHPCDGYIWWGLAARGTPRPQQYHSTAEYSVFVPVDVQATILFTD